MTLDERIDAMSDSDYMGYVARLSCLPCRLLGIYDTPAQVHHARLNGGRRDKCHKMTIPVCPKHHTDLPISIHRQRKFVERNYGMSEPDMAIETRKDVAELMSRDVRYAA